MLGKSAQERDQALENWRSQIVMSNQKAHMGLRCTPFAFTEHGALMAATVLNSLRAVEMSFYVMRTFMRIRAVLAAHKKLAANLAALGQQTAALALKHDVLAGNTRARFRQVMDALRELMVHMHWPIGFVPLIAK